MTTTADFLLIDVGNTSAKLRLATPTSLRGRTRRLPTAALLAPDGPDALRQALAGWKYGRVVMSSVVPEAGRIVASTLPDTLAIHAKLDTGVDLRGYPGAKTLGADRLANMAGALARYGPPPLIVVDFGTAATFNVLAAKGKFLGGVIAPGWAAMAGYLPTRGAQLPPVRLTGNAAPRAIGRNTAEAIRAGTILGFRGLVREILNALRVELDAPVRVIATGGDARLIAGWGAAFDAVDADLTFHGLRVIAALMASK